jgi:hypothetical protein
VPGLPIARWAEELMNCLAARQADATGAKDRQKLEKYAVHISGNGLQRVSARLILKQKRRRSNGTRCKRTNAFDGQTARRCPTASTTIFRSFENRAGGLEILLA